MMFYSYLSQFDLSKFRNISIIVKLHDENTDAFGDLDLLLSIFTLEPDLVFDFHELFDNFIYSSISHVITDFGSSLVFQVVVYA